MQNNITSTELEEIFTDIYFNAQTTDTELNKAVLEAIERAKSAIEAYVAQRVLLGRMKEVDRFVNKYSSIRKPTSKAMELTVQAIMYNRVSQDIQKYGEIRIKKLKALTNNIVGKDE